MSDKIKEPVGVYHGTVINYGKAPYLDDSKNQSSYFVELETKENQYKKLWALGLREQIENKGIEIGEKATLYDYGKQDNRRIWQVERYIETQEKTNSIENDQDLTPINNKVKEKSVDYDVDEEVEKLPPVIQNNYISIRVNKFLQSERVNFYDKEDTAAVAFEDRKQGLHTTRHDEKTVKAMLDLAEHKGWTSIKLKGSQEFRREAWLEAQMRGIKTKGYEPSEKDLAELAVRQAGRTNNQITQTDGMYTKEADKTKLEHAADSSVAMGDNLTAKTVAQEMAADAAIDKLQQEEQEDKQQEQGHDADDDLDKENEAEQEFEQDDLAQQQRDLKKVETEAYVRAEEFQRGRDIDPDPSTDVAAEAENFRTNNVAAPKVAGMSHAAATRRTEAAFDKQINGSAAGAKRDDLRKEFTENKAKLSERDQVKVEYFSRMLEEIYKDKPADIEAGYQAINDAMKDGKIAELPDPPQQVKQAEVTIQAAKQSDKDRSR